MGSSVIQYTKRAVVMALLLCSFHSVGATVGLLVEDNNQQVQQFQKALSKLNPASHFKITTLENLPSDLRSNDIRIWLAMGAKPLAVLLGRIQQNSNVHKTKILGIFVRPKAREKLEKLYPDKSFTLLDNTPQLKHQLALIKAISPQIKTVAVLHSQNSTRNFEQLKKTAQKFGLKIKVAVIKDPLNWDRTALKTLKEADVILGLNDSAIYNATTIRSILMRLYRASRPLIGPDKGYVRAGAVASTYSGVKETVQLVSNLLLSDQAWPEIIRNPHFNIVLNAQVARSLNINVTDKALLSQQVKELLK